MAKKNKGSGKLIAGLLGTAIVGGSIVGVSFGVKNALAKPEENQNQTQQEQSATNNQEDALILQTRLNKAEQDLETANSEIEALTQQKTALESQLATANSDKAALQLQLATVNENLAAAQASVETLTQQKTALESQVASLTAQIENLQSQSGGNGQSAEISQYRELNKTLGSNFTYVYKQITYDTGNYTGLYGVTVTNTTTNEENTILSNKIIRSVTNVGENTIVIYAWTDVYNGNVDLYRYNASTKTLNDIELNVPNDYMSNAAGNVLAITDESKEALHFITDNDYLYLNAGCKIINLSKIKTTSAVYNGVEYVTAVITQDNVYGTKYISIIQEFNGSFILKQLQNTELINATEFGFYRNNYSQKQCQIYAVNSGVATAYNYDYVNDQLVADNNITIYLTTINICNKIYSRYDASTMTVNNADIVAVTIVENGYTTYEDIFEKIFGMKPSDLGISDLYIVSSSATRVNSIFSTNDHIRISGQQFSTNNTGVFCFDYNY